MDHAAWKVLSERVLFEAPPFLHVSAQAVEVPGGRVIDDYYQVRMPDVASTFAETADGRILLLRSYRHGARRTCYGFPGGHLVPGEDPLVAARRELREETGYEADSWELLGDYITNANHRCQTLFFFRATGCRPVVAPDSGDLEDSEIVLLDRDGLLAAVRAGEFPFVSQITMISLALQPGLFR